MLFSSLSEQAGQMFVVSMYVTIAEINFCSDIYFLYFVVLQSIVNTHDFWYQ